MKAENITGIVLAGGQGRRMGGLDKGQVEYGGTPMVQQVINRLSPQVGQIIISANRNIPTYEKLGYPVIQDPANRNLSDTLNHQYDGPIAGMVACLSEVSTDFAIVVPCDAPLIGKSLVAQLSSHAEQSGKELTLFEVNGRLQPLFGLFHLSLLPSLKRYFMDGNRKLVRWCESQYPDIIEFQGEASTFSNINTLDELTNLELVEKPQRKT